MRKRLTDRLLETQRVRRGERMEIHDTELPGFGARIYQTKRVFFVMARIHGKLVRHTLSPGWPVLTLSEAREQARRWLMVARAGGDPRVGVSTGPRTVADLGDAFLHHYSEPNLKPLTIQHQRGYVRKLKASLGDRGLAGVQLADLVAFLDTLADRPVLQNRVRSFLRQLFGWAVQRGYLSSSPADNLPKPYKERSRRRVLVADEIRRVWSECREEGYPLGAAIQMQFAVGGQRTGDVDRMRRDEIAGDLWTIQEPTKSKDRHVVPLSSLALELLGDLPRFGGPFVFSASGGERPFASNMRRMDALRARAGFTDWHRHDIRRTVATVLADELGVAPHVAELIQNRRTIVKGVVATYNRAQYLDEQRAALEALAEWLRGVIQGDAP